MPDYSSNLWNDILGVKAIYKLELFNNLDQKINEI